MAEHSTIEWTDATVNFWWGCTKVGPGCEHCYAEVFDKRTGGAHWGAGVLRRKIKGAVALIHKLDNAYADWAADISCRDGNAKAFGLPYRRHGGLRRRVFIQSMSDLFDLDVPLDWFAEAWDRITVCNRIDIQIVTKRISAVETRLAAIGCTSWPHHAGLLVTVCNQQEADRDVPRLLALKAKLGIPWVGLSIEPLLGPIDLSRYLAIGTTPPHHEAVRGILAPDWRPPLDWVIVGGESGRGARLMHPDWARSLRDQCAAASGLAPERQSKDAAGVPFFFKQWGEWIGVEDLRRLPGSGGPGFGRYDNCQHDIRAEAVRVGKKAAGRLLDGVEHNGMPGGRLAAGPSPGATKEPAEA